MSEVNTEINTGVPGGRERVLLKLYYYSMKKSQKKQNLNVQHNHVSGSYCNN